MKIDSQKEKIVFDFRSIEKKWSDYWVQNKIYKADSDKSKPKYYCLDTWTYPSAEGVHIGYVKSFGGMDVFARYKRMKGFNVLYTTGWDSLGLPAENYAIKSGIHPRDITSKSINHFRNQFKAFGLSYDWEKEQDTADSDYYKWTQWIFLVMYERGLAYKKKSMVNWCPKDLTVLAKEQVINGKCERCGNAVEEKELEQWHFKITDYAERLYDDCNKLNWDERYLNLHKNWVNPDHLKDWCVSRQRYWGPPIPIVYCEKCGTVPVTKEALPVVLPYDVDYTPTGQPPLANNSNFINTKCPKCGGDAKREADTLDTFVSSGWYEYRFMDSKNKNEFASEEAINYWKNVDHYQGLAEHFTAHLVYARFITKVLYDAGYIKEDEPFPRYTAVGILVDKEGKKFSKRYNNAPDTDLLVENYGGDILRLSCQFISPFDEISKWGEQDIVSVKRFRDRLWRVFNEKVDGKTHIISEELNSKINVLIKSTENNIEAMKYNIALSDMMVFMNDLNNSQDKIDKNIWETFCKLLAPFAPFISEEMWYQLGYQKSIHNEPFPEYNEALIKENSVDLIIQVDGKTKGIINILKGSSQVEIIAIIKENNGLWKHLPEKYSIKYIEDKVINFITE